jgi:hypothetical protein
MEERQINDRGIERRLKRYVVSTSSPIRVAYCTCQHIEDPTNSASVSPSKDSVSRADGEEDEHPIEDQSMNSVDQTMAEIEHKQGSTSNEDKVDISLGEESFNNSMLDLPDAEEHQAVHSVPPADGEQSTAVEDESARIAREEAAKKAALAKQRREQLAAQRANRDSTFINGFDPATSWIPPGTSPEEYSSRDFVSGLERIYWRSCGLGKSAMYGADLPGSLFSKNIGGSTITSATEAAQLSRKGKHIDGPIPWDVSNLPSALTRLLPRGMKLPGVNTPYLYFGMWRATFAWHVEDMDLFSINYLHWGVRCF